MLPFYTTDAECMRLDLNQRGAFARELLRLPPSSPWLRMLQCVRLDSNQGRGYPQELLGLLPLPLGDARGSRRWDLRPNPRLTMSPMLLLTPRRRWTRPDSNWHLHPARMTSFPWTTSPMATDGIEPPYPAHEAGIVPLDHVANAAAQSRTGSCAFKERRAARHTPAVIGPRRIELRPPGSEPGIFPADPGPSAPASIRTRTPRSSAADSPT